MQKSLLKMALLHIQMKKSSVIGCELMLKPNFNLKLFPHFKFNKLCSVNKNDLLTSSDVSSALFLVFPFFHIFVIQV